MNAISFDNVTFRYDSDADPILRNATFSIRAGEFVALIGNNGSGKSTIAKICDAFLVPTSGTVTVLGHDIAEIATDDIVFDLRNKIGFVFQNPDDQLVASIVVDEIAFGPRNIGLPREEIIARIDSALEAVGMTEFVGHDVNTLSGGQRQRIAIADALAMKPQLLILDEPTSMLDPDARKSVMRIAQQLHGEGMTILLVTHDPAEAALADRVLRIQDGRVDEVTPDEWLTKFDFAAEKTRSNRASNSLPSEQAPVISFENVSFRYSDENNRGVDILGSTRDSHLVLENVNLDVMPGELLAVAGPNGCGKTTLIQHMNGLLQPTSGRVVVNGVDTATKAGRNAARHFVGITFQYPERSFFADTVYDEIAFSPRNLRLSQDEADVRVREAMDAVGLNYEEFAGRNPFSLSGGEQRKVAIAGVLAMRPEVLVLDEPCASMDMPTHAHFVELFKRLKAAGQTMVLVTHDERDIEVLADRVFRV